MARETTRADLFARPVLCCISDRANGDPVSLLRQTADCFVELFQFRSAHLTDRQRWTVARTLAAIPRASTRLLISRLADLAAAVGADGVHFPSGTFPAERALANLAGKIAGASVHSLAEAQDVAKKGADYLLLAPIFDPLSKAASGKPLGLELLHAVCSAVAIPVIALGGMVPDRFAEVLQTGAAGIAGISLFADRAQIQKTVESFRELKMSRGGPMWPP